jgi:hypothetical protein
MLPTISQIITGLKRYEEDKTISRINPKKVLHKNAGTYEISVHNNLKYFCV